jgi:hypothetical protein
VADFLAGAFTGAGFFEAGLIGFLAGVGLAGALFFSAGLAGAFLGVGLGAGFFAFALVDVLLLTI